MPDGLEDNGFPVSTLFFRSGGGSPGTLYKVAHAHGPHGHPLGDEEDGGEHQALSTKDALRDGVAQESGVGADRAIHGMMCPQTPQKRVSGAKLRISRKTFTKDVAFLWQMCYTNNIYQSFVKQQGGEHSCSMKP